MTRWIWYALSFIGCVVLLGVAFYLEKVQGLEPCPLCMFQRVAFAAFAVIALIAAVHNPQGFFARIYALIAALVAGVGVALAGRHVWLQSLPADQVPECGPGLDYLLNVFPFEKVIETVLSGSGECAEVDKVLGVSIAIWTLLIFLGLLLMSLTFLLTRFGLFKRQ